ncbi:hypothetical protein ACEN2I_16895 [Flavobacterium sp. W22_SRS_FK3]|uniref:hypothetical protein n=1 Tax=Flavobacterium sp. W22_SRS_FK3 TaxID=3240275 RepID=UPI003F907C0D
MSKRFLETEGVQDLAVIEQTNFFFADEKEEKEQDEMEDKPDIDKGGKVGV